MRVDDKFDSRNIEKNPKKTTGRLMSAGSMSFSIYVSERGGML